MIPVVGTIRLQRQSDIDSVPSARLAKVVCPEITGNPGGALQPCPDFAETRTERIG